MFQIVLFFSCVVGNMAQLRQHAVSTQTRTHAVKILITTGSGIVVGIMNCAAINRKRRRRVK